MSMEAKAQIDRIREDLAAYPADLVDWEAACLKNVANLLDSLEHARGEWGSLSRKLQDLQARVAETEGERDRLAEAGKRGLDQAKSERDALAARIEETQSERDDVRARLEEATAELVAVRGRREKAEQDTANARTDLAETRQRLEKAERERDLLAENIGAFETVQSDLRAARTKLKEAERERDAQRDVAERLALAEKHLDEMRTRLAEVQRERDRLRDLEGKWTVAQSSLGEAKVRLAELAKECERFRLESEQRYLLLCDVRARENRMETERDEAQLKKRKILAKVHEKLDQAGAPQGDLSYGERIRWLHKKLTDLEAR